MKAYKGSRSPFHKGKNKVYYLPKLADIHNKAMLLMNPENDLGIWLAPKFKKTEAITDLMRPKLRMDI